MGQPPEDEFLDGDLARWASGPRRVAPPQVEAPTLLIVGGDDTPVIQMNRDAMRRMRAPVKLEIVPDATHLFEEPGALEKVARLAADWCRRHLNETKL